MTLAIRVDWQDGAVHADRFRIGVDGKDVIGVTFLAKRIPGKRGLGNANRLGKSINYVISPENGEILRISGTK
ncbi:hypothetical protein G3N57_02840 [Paraburkholderia sp. Se-20369]|nr:hypothetical protein [Paraburkholderia sp. Se-20369]TCW81177.1 hypothetical protein C5O80_23745 [Burkholderia sp. SRS-46]